MKLSEFSTPVTVFHREDTKEPVWKKTVFSDCFWKSAECGELQNSTREKKNSFLCRIPVKEKISVSPGDFAVKGEVFEEAEDVPNRRPRDILNKYEGFSVTLVKDNSGFSYFPHIRIEGG